MSEWKKVKLGDVCEITSSKRCHASERSTDGVPFYCSKEIIQLDKGEEILHSDYIPVNLYESIKERFGVPNTGDLLLTTRGTNGIPYIYKENDYFYFADGNLSWFKNFTNDTDVRFIYYWFKSHEGKHIIDSIAKGTAQKAVPIEGLKNIEILTPTYTTQHRIATILSRYDSLIENYRKQIKLLEEAAQRLYKEWFVDLHFPGHENTKIVDGVPEGWERRTLDSFCSVFTGKKNANQGVVNGKYKFFTCGDTPLLINSYIFDGPAIIISGNGSYTGRTTFYEGKFDLYQRTYACTLKDTNNSDLIYGLYEIVKCELTNKILGGTHGAAIPYIVMSDLTKFDFLFNESVMNSFSTTIKNFLSISLKFQNKIRLLTEARDRLLPKLMSGEIAV